MTVSVTLGAYMAAICSASCSVASLMMAGDPLPGASLVMPIAFLRLEGAHSAPSMHHEEALRILPVVKISGNVTYRISATPYARILQKSPTRRFVEQRLGYYQDNVVNIYRHAALLPD